jgi:integrase
LFKALKFDEIRLQNRKTVHKLCIRGWKNFMGTKYHLFRRKLINSRGKEYTVWYYWYKENGKQIRKPCGRGCRLKRDAEEFIAKLEAQESDPPTPVLKSKHISFAAAIYRTFQDLAAEMFLPDSLHLKRQTLADGIAIKETTRLGHRGRLENYLVPKWGRFAFDRFEDEGFVYDFQDWLVSLRKTGKDEPISNSLRNNIIETMSICLREAKRKRLIKTVPDMGTIRFVRHSRRQNTLSLEEIYRLFPEDPAALDAVWRRKDTRDYPGTGILFGAMFCLGLSAGLRSGELRAVSRDQFVQHRLQDGSYLYGLIVDRAYDSTGQISSALKKGNDEDLRHRAVILSDKTMRIVNLYLDSCPVVDGPVFLYHGHPVSKDLLNARWKVGLANAQIDMSDNRRMTVHALRYTYNTRMKALVSEQTLHEFIGHNSSEMTEHYDRPHMEERLLQLADQRGAVERFWG